MEKENSSSHAVVINDEESICPDDDTIIDTGKLTLTFHPDETEPIDKEKMQRIWNYIESKSEFREMMVTFSAAKTKKSTAEKLLLICKEDSAKEISKIDESCTKNVLDIKEEIPERRPQTAIELLDHFQGLHNMLKPCLKKSKKMSQTNCWHCPSNDSFQENLDDVLGEIKSYEENLVTQVIGDKRAKRVYKHNNYSKK